MNLSESIARLASDPTPGPLPVAFPSARPDSPASSAFASALAAAKNAAARFDGSTPSAPAEKSPTLRPPHQTNVPVAPDSPVQALLASAAAGATAVIPSAQNAFAPNTDSSAAPNSATAISDVRSSLASAEDSIANAADALETAAAAAYRALDSISSTIQKRAVTASPFGEQSSQDAALPGTAAANGMPATTATSSPQNIGSTGSKFLDSILESLPVVGNVMRLMQGSESRVDPAGVAFASSGAAAQPSPNGSDSANSPSSPGLAPNPPAAPTSALNPVLALPQIPRNVAMPEVLPGLPAVHQIAPPLPSNSAPRAANPSSAHDSQPVLGNGPVTSTSPSQQSISDAPSNVAQKVGAAVQSALAASNSNRMPMVPLPLGSRGPPQTVTTLQRLRPPRT